MNTSPIHPIRKWAPLAVLLFAVSSIGASYSWWWPGLSQWVNTSIGAARNDRETDADPMHAVEHPTSHDHDHDHDAHAASATSDSNHRHDAAGHGHDKPVLRSDLRAIELTPQALQNLGLTDEYLRPIELQDFRRSITVPAVIAAKPGRSRVVVTSPLNGIITHVHAVTGEAVVAGELLFEVRLTYEDLVETQTTFLRTISELEVEQREIERLEQASRSGAISGKALLERRYAKDKLDAFLRSQREALRLHGLSDRQIDAIASDGKLLQDLQIVAPDIDGHPEDEELRLSGRRIRSVAFVAAEKETPMVLEDLRVHKGQAVVAGETLCNLADYTNLFVEGKAFEQDAAAIATAVQRGWAVDAIVSESDQTRTITDLKIAYVDNAIDQDSRTLSFFVELPNEMVRDVQNESNQRFVTWEYRVGQRLQLRIPVEEWQDQIVLPVEAVVQQGADWYVFEKNGTHFDRIPVHVRYRGQTLVVIANDGAIAPGDIVARRGAYQLNMAIKNQSGGGVDPHAGHSH